MSTKADTEFANILYKLRWSAERGEGSATLTPAECKRLLKKIESPYFRFVPEKKDSWTCETWNRAYDDAMAWRDWQSCEVLLDERGRESWWPK